ncbi:TetR family transcriptional regulator [Bacillus timonensis]|uniref:TetR family transcriptional regulator n=1 Tax=Bacillus timonensis TaxID=1033734 RepID=UPI000287D8FA|nr:TetR family transcriptional regulator [Bacillus timonensis]
MSPIVSEQHREERKNLILKAAKDVFIKKGFNATTIQDIINHSGVSRGGVYTYFKNTEDVFIELLKKRDMEDVWDLESIYRGGHTNWEALEFILDNVQENILNQTDRLVPAIYEYYFTKGWETKRHLPFLEARVEQAWNGLAFILQKGIDEKEFTPSLPTEDIAKTILTFYDGIMLTNFQLGPEKLQLPNQFHVFRVFLSTCLFESKNK